MSFWTTHSVSIIGLCLSTGTASFFGQFLRYTLYHFQLAVTERVNDIENQVA